MSDLFNNKEGKAGMFAGLTQPLSGSIQTSTRNSVQESIQDSVQTSTQDSTQISTQERVQICVQTCTQFKTALRTAIDADLQRKIKYMPITLRVGQDVVDALKGLSDNKDLPRGIQQATADNILKIGLAALGYLPPEK